MTARQITPTQRRSHVSAASGADLVPVILCGGSGSRLWPVSRDQCPKPFMRLPDGQTLLQKAFERATRLAGVHDLMVVGSQALGFQLEQAWRDAATQGVTASFILEPCQRNTAAAIAAAALQVQALHGETAELLVLPADHLVEDPTAFARAVRRARTLAREGRLVTFGVRPDRAETGYGYIEPGVAGRVKRFLEKPDAATAEAFLAGGRHLWNAGMFCFQAGALLRELRLHQPDLVRLVEDCIASSHAGEEGTALSLDAQAFAAVPSVSIDTALFERSAQVAVVPCSIGWSDVGSWDSFADLSAPDAQDNRIEGHGLLHDSHGCYVRSTGRMVGAVGVDNLVIIETPDAVLVADRSRTQDVRHLYQQLKAQGHETHRNHAEVQRPWGSYTVLAEGPMFKVKRLEVHPGAALSLQLHHHRNEHWVVVSGQAQVTNGEQVNLLQANESTYIPAGCQHRLRNPGSTPLVVIEVQSGARLDEDDIVRLEDRYGRV